MRSAARSSSRTGSEGSDSSAATQGGQLSEEILRNLKLLDQNQPDKVVGHLKRAILSFNDPNERLDGLSILVRAHEQKRDASAAQLACWDFVSEAESVFEAKKSSDEAALPDYLRYCSALATLVRIYHESLRESDGGELARVCTKALRCTKDADDDMVRRAARYPTYAALRVALVRALMAQPSNSLSELGPQLIFEPGVRSVFNDHLQAPKRGIPKFGLADVAMCLEGSVRGEMAGVAAFNALSQKREIDARPFAEFLPPSFNHALFVVGSEPNEEVIETVRSMPWACAGQVAEPDAVLQSIRELNIRGLRMACANVTQFLINVRQYDNAIGVFDRALETLGRLVPGSVEHTDTLVQAISLLYNLSYERNEISYRNKAEVYVDEVVDLDPSDFVPEAADALARGAGLLADARMSDDAEQLFRKSIEILEETNGNDLEIASRMNDLGHLLLDTNELDDDDLAEARKFLSQSLSMREELLPSHHPQRNNALHSYGILLMRSKEYQEAKRCFLEAQEGFRAGISALDSSVSSGLVSGGSPAQQDKVDTDFLEKRIATLEGHLGENAFHRGKYTEAEHHITAAIKTKLKLYGEGSNEVNLEMSNLASVQMTTGDYTEASANYGRIIQNILLVGGDSAQDDVAHFRMIRSGACLAAGDLRAAVSLREEAFKIMEHKMEVQEKVKYWQKHSEILRSLGREEEAKRAESRLTQLDFAVPTLATPATA